MDKEKQIGAELFSSINEYINNYYIPNLDELSSKKIHAVQKSCVRAKENISSVPNGAIIEPIFSDMCEMQSNSDMCEVENFEDCSEDLCTQDIVCEPLIKEGKSAKKSLSDLISRLDETFSESVLRIIDQKGLNDSAVYKKANIDRKHFSKIRSNKDYRPSKGTVLALCIALKLNLDETKDLLLKAGFALSRSNKADVIVQYFIEKQDYEIMVVNAALYEFGQSVIGG